MKIILNYLTNISHFLVPRLHHGFTIVELLIVVVIIGILAGITVASYSGITSQAKLSAIKSELNSATRKLQLYYTKYGNYPTTIDANNCPNAPIADTDYCLKASSGTTYTYQAESGTSADYALYATNSGTIYKITSSASPFITKLSSACPAGFIVVPGSSTYGTNDFCAMKYEAKCALLASATTGLISPATSQNTYSNSTTACTAANSRGVVSLASGYPIANLDQATASTYASNAYACVGCSLISEAQWLTIAQNVLSNPVNWSGGIVGSGTIPTGHSDGSPNKAQVAGDDIDGYYATGNSSGNQKRTLVLTNGEVIWDLAGNIWEWTSGQTTGGQPTGTPINWREWTAVSGGTISPSPYPATTGLSGSGTWTSSNGIGQVMSDSADNTLKGFIRGGRWLSAASSGVLALTLSSAPTYNFYDTGFRVAR